MRRMWQKLLLVVIILSCGIIFSLGSSARDTAPAKVAQNTVRAVGNPSAAPPAKVVVYAQDRHGPW